MGYFDSGRTDYDVIGGKSGRPTVISVFILSDRNYIKDFTPNNPKYVPVEEYGVPHTHTTPSLSLITVVLDPDTFGEQKRRGP